MHKVFYDRSLGIASNLNPSVVEVEFVQNGVLPAGVDDNLETGILDVFVVTHIQGFDLRSH